MASLRQSFETLNFGREKTATLTEEPNNNVLWKEDNFQVVKTRLKIW